MISDGNDAEAAPRAPTAGCTPCGQDGEEGRRDRIMATRAVKGLIIVHTGAGKKSSSAFGMIVRCVATVFARWCSSSRAPGRASAGCWPGILAISPIPRDGEGFTWETQDRARDIAQRRPVGRRPSS